MPIPTYRVEIALGTAPLTAPGVWTDISSYVRGIQIRRGRDHELAQSQAGECTIRLRNTDRRFDPSYASGPYFGTILPMRQIRVTATHNAVDYPLFYGYIEDWSQTWPGRPISAIGDAECVVHAVDGFKLLSLYQLKNTYPTEVIADGPDAYYRLDETPVPIIVNGIGGPAYWAHNGTFGAVGPLTGGATAYQAAVGTGVTDTIPFVAGGAASGSNPTFEFWIYVVGLPVGNVFLMGNGNFALGSYGSMLIQLAASGQLTHYWGDVGSGPSATDAGWTLGTGAWTHVAFVHDSSGNITFYKNGAATGAVVAAGVATPTFDMGTVLNLAGAQVGSEIAYARFAHMAAYNYPLPAARIKAHYSATFSVLAASQAGAQVTLLLDQIGWPAGLRSIDTGVPWMQQFDPAGSALTHLLAICEDSERGLLQMSADGNVTFHDRADMLATSGSHGASQATFGEAEIAYADLEGFRNDDQDLWTRINVSRDGGPAAHDTDATALTAYGPRTLDLNASHLFSDDETQLIAAYSRLAYRYPTTRPVSVTLDLTNDTTSNAAILGRDTHHDRVTIVRRPQGGGSQTIVCHVEGIEYDITPGEISTGKLHLVPDLGITFISDECTATTGLNGGVTTAVSGTAAAVTVLATSIDTQPGWLKLDAGTTTTGRAALIGVADAVQLGALETIFHGRYNLPAVSDGTNTFTVRLGLGDSSSAESVDFIGFRYTHSVVSGHWQGVCRSNSVETTVDTGVAAYVSPGIQIYKLSFIVNVAGTSVQFYVDDVATGSAITTNIPTGSARKLTYLPGFILKSAGTSSRYVYVGRYGYVLGP